MIVSDSFLKELLRVFTRPQFWLYAAVVDVSVTYRNNQLGFSWIFISNFLFTAILGNLYAGMMGVPILEYVVHLYSGLILWNLMSHSVTEATRVMEAQQSFLTASRLTFMHLIMRIVFKNYIIFLHNIAPLYIVLLWSRESTLLHLVYALLVGVTLVLAVIVLLAVLCVQLNLYVRDVKDFLSSIFRIGFLATPIIWMEDRVTQLDSARDGIRYYIELNPFYHLIEVFRAPMESTNSLTNSLLPVAAMIPVLFVVNLFLFSYSKDKLNSVL